MIEINLATFDKQEEILSSFGGGETLMYMLAKADSTASQSDIEALKDVPHIKNIINSEAALRAIGGSRGCVEKIVNSSTAIELINSNSWAIAKIVATIARLSANDYADVSEIANSSTAMEEVVNSSAAMDFVVKFSTAIEAVADSRTATEALLNSKKARILTNMETITGRFLPLKASIRYSRFEAYNGEWTEVDGRLGWWLKDNSSNPVATKIRDVNNQEHYYYDLNA